MVFTNIFQISVYSLIFAASGILAVAEGGAAPSLLTFVIALAAFFFNERRQIFGLSDMWANSLALGAFGIATYEFFGESEEAKLLSGTHLIVYLLWIIVFWNRELRHYWWICALCLLHVALAAVLTQAGWFGAALIGYVLLMIWVLTLFAFFRATQEIAATGIAAPTPLSHPPAQSLPTAQAMLTTQSSRTRGHVQGDAVDGLVLRRMAFGVFPIALVSLFIGGVIFMFTPRVWMNASQTFAQNRTDLIPGGKAVTGFSEQVRLGDIGEILESNQPVLTLQAFEHHTGKPLNVLQLAESYGMPEPYLRGAVLVTYQGGTWHPSSASLVTHALLASPRKGRSNLVRQEIVMESLGTKLLFAMRPYASQGSPYGGELLEGGETEIKVTSGTCSLVRESGTSRVRYQIFSPAPGKKTHNDLTPFYRFPSRPVDGEQDSQQEEHLQPPGARLQRLNALALQVASRVQGDPRNRRYQLAVAHAMESHLRDSGKYRYSLDASISDSRIDPVEDFLFNRKSGHCEYYAAALTLMLRSANIPSRLVNGFKGGEYDEAQHVLHVEQRHAHSWVEAFVGNEWITLDPTPFGEREKIIAANKPGVWESLSRGFWNFWNERVVRVSLGQQQKEIFFPLLKKIHKAFTSTAGFRALAADLWHWLRNTALSPQSWFSFHGGLVAFILMATPVLLFRLVRGIWKRLSGVSRRRLINSRRTFRTVEFYERFQRLLAKRGIVRESHQTQREFGSQIQQELDPLLENAALDDVGSEIANSFYRVRFGNEPLEGSEQDRIDERLGLLESALKQKPK